MKSKHTPGEWKVSGIIVESDELIICSCHSYTRKGSCSNREAEANAKLMAAAPELLHRLNSLVLSIMAHPDYTGEENEEWTDLIESANGAIKKATE